jgi:hypothetical protein
MTLNLDKSSWKRVAFGDVIDSITDRVDNPSDAGVDRYVGLEHLDPGVMTVQRWDAPDKVEAQKLRFLPGDVIFGRRRAYQKKVGRADFEGICSAHALVLRARPDYVHPDFLPVFLSSDYFLDRAIEISVGSLSPTINWRDLKVQEFQLPPLREQKRIADLLWALERDRLASDELLRSAIATRDALIELRFAADTNGTLQDLCPLDGIRIGPFGTQLHAYDYAENGACPVVMPQDMVDGRVSTANIQRITDERAQELVVHRLQAGDIVLPRRGELDRRVLITEAEDGWLCGTGSVRVRLREGVSNRAVFLALSSATTVDWLKANATGTTMPNLNAGIIARIPISLLTGQALEAALEEVDHLDSSARAIRSRITATAALRSSLLSDIFGDN